MSLSWFQSHVGFLKWVKMGKKLHKKKVFSQKPISIGNTPTFNPQSILNVSLDEIGIKGLAQTTMQHMWTKAEDFVKSDGHILQVPWSDDPKARLVKSSTSVQPHLVTRDSKNVCLYRCDANCLSICSHVIATAHINGELKLFLKNVNKCEPNLSAIANHGMPSGTGRKGGVAKCKRVGKIPSVETRSIRPSLVHTPGAKPPSDPLSTDVGMHDSFTGGPSSSSFQPPTTHGSTVRASGSQQLSTSPRNIIGASSAQPPKRRSAIGAQQLSASSLPFSTVPISPSTTPGSIAPTIGTANLSSRSPSVVNYAGPTSRSSASHGTSSSSMKPKPFVLKFKTNQIRICQSCRKNYDGPDLMTLWDSLWLVLSVAWCLTCLQECSFWERKAIPIITCT